MTALHLPELKFHPPPASAGARSHRSHAGVNLCRPPILRMFRIIAELHFPSADMPFNFPSADTRDWNSLRELASREEKSG